MTNCPKCGKTITTNDYDETEYFKCPICEYDESAEMELLEDLKMEQLEQM